VPAPIKGHFPVVFQAVDSRLPIGRITVAQPGFWPSGRKFPGEFFVSGLVRQGGQVRIRGLLFDNLVSDLQFFCQLKTVQAEV